MNLVIKFEIVNGEFCKAVFVNLNHIIGLIILEMLFYKLAYVGEKF